LPPMRHPVGLSAGILPQVQPYRKGWGIISDDDQGQEALSLGQRRFHRYWSVHRDPALNLPIQQKPWTSSTDCAAALTTRFRANSCNLALQDRNSSIGSHGSCGQGTIRSNSTRTLFSCGIGDTCTITVLIFCERPRAGPAGWSYHVCISDRHPQFQRRGGTPGHLERMGEDSGGAARYCRLVQYALSGAGEGGPQIVHSPASGSGSIGSRRCFYGTTQGRAHTPDP